MIAIPIDGELCRIPTVDRWIYLEKHMLCRCGNIPNFLIKTDRPGVHTRFCVCCLPTPTVLQEGQT